MRAALVVFSQLRVRIASASKVEMAYHSKTISLLGLPIRTSPVARQTLDDLAKTVNQPLPAAVREWYELEDAVELIGRFSNCDHPVPIDALKRSLLEVRKEGLPDPRQNTFLVFKSENQGVCTWAVLLDGSADPPVFLDFDSAFNSPVKCADAFSQYLYSCVWDYSQVLAANSLLLQAQNSALSDEALESLCQSFDQECVTFGWPGERQFRFSRGDQRIQML